MLDCERFFRKTFTDANGCWIWRGERTAAGYGVFRVGKQKYRAHRYSWEMWHPPIEGGLYVLHKCDHPWCVAPLHLYLGDHRQNMADMIIRGRCSSAPYKLDEDDVREIRHLHATTDLTQVEIGRLFDVSGSMVHHIIHRQWWKDVEQRLSFSLAETGDAAMSFVNDWGMDNLGTGSSGSGGIPRLRSGDGHEVGIPVEGDGVGSGALPVGEVRVGDVASGAGGAEVIELPGRTAIYEGPLPFGPEPSFDVEFVAVAVDKNEAAVSIGG